MSNLKRSNGNGMIWKRMIEIRADRSRGHPFWGLAKQLCVLLQMKDLLRKAWLHKPSSAWPSSSFHVCSQTPFTCSFGAPTSNCVFACNGPRQEMKSSSRRKSQRAWYFPTGNQELRAASLQALPALSCWELSDGCAFLFCSVHKEMMLICSLPAGAVLVFLWNYELFSDPKGKMHILACLATSCRHRASPEAWNDLKRPKASRT